MDSKDNSIPSEDTHFLSHSDPAKKPNNTSTRNPFNSHSQERAPQKEEPENQEGSTDKGDFVIKKNLNTAAVRPNFTQTAPKNPFGAQPAPPKEEGSYKNPFKAMAEMAAKNPPATKNEGSPDANGNRHNSPLPSNKIIKASESKPVEGGSSNKLENLGFSADELLAGEVLVSSIRCTVMLIQYPTVVSPGLLVISNYRLMFKPDLENFFKRYPLKSDYLKIPLGFILKVDRAFDKRELSVCYIDIYSKDGRTIRLKIAEKLPNESHSIIQYLSIYSFPEKKEYFFAFYFNKAARELEDKFQGWKIYDIQKEFKRQGIDFIPLAEDGAAAEHSPLAKHKIVDNRFFRLSPTYPPFILVPSKMNDQALQTCSKFRTKERLPVITYYYKKAGTYLSRSSQSKPGIYQSRCVEDELLLRYLGDHNYDESTDMGGPTDINLNIYDARPYLNAVANKVHGKGYEDTKYYRNCEIDFMDIDNIHHVREAHRKLQNLCFSSDASNPKWYSQLESTNWLELISLITSAASKVAQSLRKGRNCLVHCSDGWDRTAQILTLAQIMLDPYFRTIEGFEILIMKDWVSFGHQFSLRMGHGNKNYSDDQRSPVFLQFLDCVQQLLHQYPFAFEFNDKFLADIAYHAYSCQFGTFLCNTYQEVILYQLESRTISVWSYLNSQKEKYKNPYYDEVYEHSSLVLRPSTHLKYLRLWEEYFLYYSWLAKPNYTFSHEITFCKDFYDFMYRKEKKKSVALLEEVKRLQKKLKDAGIEDEEEIVEEIPKKEAEEKEEEKKEEEEEELRKAVVKNLEGDKDQIEAKEIEEEEVVKLVEKHEKLEAVTPKNEVMGDNEKIAEFEP